MMLLPKKVLSVIYLQALIYSQLQHKTIVKKVKKVFLLEEADWLNFLSIKVALVYLWATRYTTGQIIRIH